MSTGVSNRLLPLHILAMIALGVSVGTACADADDPTTVGPVGPVGPVGDDDADDVEGSGTIAAVERGVQGIDRIVLTGEGAIVVTFGEAETLKVVTDDNLLEYIETEVSGGTLQIRTRTGIDIAPTESVEYEIGVVGLEAVELGGAGSIDIGSWSTDAATIKLIGAGDINVDELVADDLVVDLPGVGTITIDGSVDEQDASISGVGEYRAGALRSRVGSIDASGATAATVWVTDTLDVAVRGPASVEYHGEPEIDDDVRSNGSLVALGPK